MPLTEVHPTRLGLVVIILYALLLFALVTMELQRRAMDVLEEQVRQLQGDVDMLLGNTSDDEDDSAEDPVDAHTATAPRHHVHTWLDDVHRDCLAARRDGRIEDICDQCWPQLRQPPGKKKGS